MYIGTATDLPHIAQFAPGSNQSKGFDVDLFQWLANNTQRGFYPIPVPLLIKQREDALESGRVQMVVEAYSIVDEKKNRVSFAGPYMITQQGVMVRAGDTRISSADDLVGKTVCTLTGSTSFRQLAPLNGRATITTEDSGAECVKDLEEGQVDAVTTDQLVLYGFQLDASTAVAVLPNIRFGQYERYGIGLPKGDVAACQAITQSLVTLITSRQWDTFFTAEFPGLDSSTFRPNPYQLDSCNS
ncbi:transporter substrate-binding domain-containing protein [Actinomycetospora sp. TBRC 11914]|uniref:transporter substrate-binding domain-containing protein n=1 Tax=Actinomycetospora sp. TBRC 11914 TaxID=2729387 RepID=UPI00145EBA3D|nr:transporter substrate-binding domain-containing protein [Actinomycetospora sp. TBRC 11914]NMO93710.1 transporter substrate-binding domain-containing protein [Actinomycetospora sp. TBRC 11914]